MFGQSTEKLPHGLFVWNCGFDFVVGLFVLGKLNHVIVNGSLMQASTGGGVQPAEPGAHGLGGVGGVGGVGGGTGGVGGVGGGVCTTLPKIVVVATTSASDTARGQTPRGPNTTCANCRSPL